MGTIARTVFVIGDEVQARERDVAICYRWLE